jgi:hypothetical protein
MNSLYGAYESWHTDIYTQIMQAGRECFADFIKPMSDYVHNTLEGIEDAEVRSVALGCLSQFDQMVKAATDDTGNSFLRWALEEGFAPQNDNNPFWLDVNQLKGLGYKRMVREAYSKHIEDDAEVLAKEVDEKANKVVDDLLELLTEESAQE